MSAAFLFGDLDNKLLVVGDGEFLQGKDCAFRRLAMHDRHIVLGTERVQLLLLHGGSLDDFLIHNLEAHIVDVEGYVGGVLQFRVEIQQTVVGIDGFQKELNSETL